MPRKTEVSRREVEPRRPNLTMPWSKADELLASRISIGKQFQSAPIRTEADFEEVQHKHRIWDAYNTELLRRMFDSDELSTEYGFWGASWLVDTLADRVRQLSGKIADHITRLESIKERLPLFPELPTTTSVTGAAVSEPTPTTRTVFVVHGADHGAKDGVARYLASLGLDPIILHEQANQGATIIEKLERESPVAFSVVLLTSDDNACHAGDTTSLRPRPRQNVVFELGFFIGKLGRKRVCALYSDGVELPSDFQGVVYIGLDDHGAWKLALARELRAAGLDINLDGAL